MNNFIDRVLLGGIVLLITLIILMLLVMVGIIIIMAPAWVMVGLGIGAFFLMLYGIGWLIDNK